MRARRSAENPACCGVALVSCAVALTAQTRTKTRAEYSLFFLMGRDFITRRCFRDVTGPLPQRHKGHRDRNTEKTKSLWRSLCSDLWALCVSVAKSLTVY